MTSAAPHVSIVIPAYNEEEGIVSIIQRIQQVDAQFEILVMDDGSQDKTAEVARQAGAIVISHPYNIGNGAAVKRGILEAKGEIVIMIDADGQHPPENIPLLLEKLSSYQMAVGSRTRKSKVSRFRTVGNDLLRALASYLTDTPIADLTSGFRAFYRESALEFVHLFPNRYSYPTTLTMAFITSGYPVAWVPMDNIGKRQTGRSHLRPFRDGVRFIGIMIRIIMLFNPQKVFLPTGFLFLLIGIALSIYTVIINTLQASAVLMVMIGVFVLLFGLIAEQLATIRRELKMH